MKPAPLLLGLFLALAAPLAQAAGCSISAQPVAFGSYSALDASPRDAVGQVTVTCSNALSILLSYTVSLSQGGSGRYDYREMASGSHRLRYNLFTDITRLIVWGDGSAGTGRISNTILIDLFGVSVNHSVYGRVPAGQSVAVGSYGDIITATVDY